MKMNSIGLLICITLTALAGFAGEDSGNEVVILPFEAEGPNPIEGADKLQFVAEHATYGKTSGKAKLDNTLPLSIGFYGGTCMKGRWNEFNTFVLDVFVEDGPVDVYCFIRDNQTTEKANWDTRYNENFLLQPGKRSLTLPLAGLNRQNGKGTIDLKQMQSVSLVFSAKDPQHIPTIYVDNGRLIKGGGSVVIKTLYSFEGNDAGKVVLEDWPPEFKGKSSMTMVEEHATDTKKALRLESHSPAGNVQFSGFEGDWSRYDTLAIDFFNPSDKPVKIGGWIRSGDLNASWDRRHNWERILRPGLNTMKLPSGGLTMPDGKPIDASKIVSFNLGVDNQTIFVDNIRLIKGVEEIAVKGMQKFAFGPPNAALMPGFTRATKNDAYTQARGWGWLNGGEFARDTDIHEVLGRHRPADSLCASASMPVHGTFAVDLPNGDYQVWVMQAPPGFGWGGIIKHRSVKAQGQIVFDQEFNAQTFKEYEFKFQDSEDLPGDDLWDRYINVYFHPVQFDDSVTDGQLKLDFDSYGQWGWATMLNGIVLWPKAEAGNAAKWLAGLDAARKEQYQALHVENLPPAPPPFAATPENQARGYVRFIHSPDREVEVNSVPQPHETAAAAIELSVSPGEYQDGCFGVYALKSCGKLKVSLSDLAGPGGASIPASNIKLMVTRYKALNQTAIYTILPKYLDDVPADGIDIKPGVTRSFWLITHVPPATAPGTYKGRVLLNFDGAPADHVDVTVTVWPIKLAEPDFPMGMFMMGTQSMYPQLDGAPDAVWNEWKDILNDAHEHGLTSVDPMIGVQLTKFANGRAEVNFAEMDRFMELAKAAGFHREICGYSIQTGFKMRISPELDLAAEARRWGANSYGELVKAYFDAVREHAKQKNWLPVCFCTDDEYVIHPDSKPEFLAALHKALQDNAPGFHFAAFDSVLYKEHPEKTDAYDSLLNAVDTWGAGLHTPRESEVLKKAHHRLWLYNTGMDRFTFGTYMFYARRNYDVSGFFQWIYSGGGSYGHFYLASFNEAHYGVVYPSSHGLRPTPLWERIRSGCNDHRYLETAWNLIAQAQSSGKGAAEAKALRDTIEQVFARLKFGNERIDAKAAADGQGKATNPMDPAAMDALRKNIAEEIIKLQAKL
jgi:hypothetical protein